MPAAGGDDVHWHPVVEKGGLVASSQIVETQPGEPQSARLPDKASCNRVGIPWARQINVCAGGQVRETSKPIGHPGDHAEIFLALG
jgi:hypothetical protein